MRPTSATVSIQVTWGVIIWYTNPSEPGRYQGRPRRKLEVPFPPRSKKGLSPQILTRLSKKPGLLPSPRSNEVASIFFSAKTDESDGLNMISVA